MKAYCMRHARDLRNKRIREQRFRRPIDTFYALTKMAVNVYDVQFGHSLEVRGLAVIQVRAHTHITLWFGSCQSAIYSNLHNN